MGYKIVGEDQDRFLVHDGSAQFPVAKEGLGSETLKRIKGYADGGEVFDPNAPQQSVMPDRADQIVDKLNAPPGPVVNPDPADAIVSALQAPPTGPVFTPGQGAAPAPQDLPQTVAPQRPAAPAVVVNVPPQQAAPASTPQPASRQAPVASRPPVNDELNQAINEQIAAEKAKADIAKTQAAEVAKLQLQNEVVRQKVADAREQRMAIHEKRGQAIFDSIMTDKVDPNHFWASKDTSDRIGSAFAIMLGGLGAGLSRGPNVVMEQINRDIDRDIDAQKANINKKQNLFSMHLQQGHDANEAYQLTKADMMDGAAAQMQMMATKHAGERAAPEALRAIGELRVKAKEIRQNYELKQSEIASRYMQNQIAMGELGLKQQEMGMKQAQRVAMMRLANGTATSADIPWVPPEMQSRIVKDGNGYKLALTEKDADTIKTKSEGVAELTSAIKRGESIREKASPIDIALPSGWTKSGQAAQNERQGIYVAAAKAIFGAEPKSLGSTDLEMLDRMVPNLMGLRGDTLKVKLDEMKKIARANKAISMSERMP